MRLTIMLDDDLLAEARGRAARSGRTLSQVVEDALLRSFARSDAATAERARLPVFHGSRLVPGVDPDDSAALLDVMEARA